MRYQVSLSMSPIDYISCGQLFRKSNFLHPRRKINSTVLIFVNTGVLYITQANRKFEIGKNQFIILYEGQQHYGWKPSEDTISYYWVHFVTPQPIKQCHNDDEVKRFMQTTVNQKSEEEEFFIFPETGSIGDNKKLPLLFGQLLEYGQLECMNARSLRRYSLSLLLMELSREALQSFSPGTDLKPSISKIQDWINHNYLQSLSVREIADQFHYNPDYLSSDFKRHTGMSMTRYIQSKRIENAKNLLTSYNLSIKEAAFSSGFLDEKYFMKVFKAHESITPTDYKKAFYRKKTISS